MIARQLVSENRSGKSNLLDLFPNCAGDHMIAERVKLARLGLCAAHVYANRLEVSFSKMSMLMS